MGAGIESLFSNVESYFRLMITIEYFRIVILFVLFIYVLYLLTKIIKVK